MIVRKLTPVWVVGMLMAITACQPDEPTKPHSPKDNSACGCTDTQAANYSPHATCDNGSCIYLDEDKKTLNTLFTSTGCGACGLYGIDCHKGYSAPMLAHALRFELHFKYGDPMINPTNDSLVKVARPGYSPFFAVGLRESMEAGPDRPTTCSLSRARAQALVNDFVATAPNTRIAIGQRLVDRDLFVDIAIDAPEYDGIKYAVYVLEDSLVYTQNAGWRNDIEGWVHGDVVRAALTPVLGRPLMAASTTRQLS
ncbi:MAG: hypothetical protein HYZ16_04080, partial [Bacteroidetes bacterium]|nr:hypothetical protein [Bacteroidota bacterium]